ncbi:30S ribosomal protein S18 [Candidatus Babeliales bacterium]|nr:30S ribosomal protein S18 [Candidatus Babeliales bacterium]MCF7899765.1 30S ribosomal protein S18 [Candidatus Babeliales bacterium]
MSKFKLKVSSRLLKKKVRKQSYLSQKHCRFCMNAELEKEIDYKNINLLKNFLTERGKILPSRVSGNCFFHQRGLANQIKLARSMALLPYISMHR